MIILVWSGMCVFVCVHTHNNNQYDNNSHINDNNSHTDEHLLKNPLDEEHIKEGTSAAGSQ